MLSSSRIGSSELETLGQMQPLESFQWRVCHHQYAGLQQLTPIGQWSAAWPTNDPCRSAQRNEMTPAEEMHGTATLSAVSSYCSTHWRRRISAIQWSLLVYRITSVVARVCTSDEARYCTVNHRY